MAQKFIVVFTDRGGPYTLHQLGSLLLPISHSGSGVSDKFVAHSEESVVHKIVMTRTGRVVVHIFDSPHARAKAIAEFLLEKHAGSTLNSFFNENVKMVGLVKVKLYGT
jgi:hypothetical protein